MKIEGNGPNPLGGADQTQKTDRSAEGAGRKPEQGRAAGDRIEVSDDARLVNEAVREAAESPDIRTDHVERAKAKLEAGEIGNDVQRLADRLIDDLLDR